MSLCEPRTALFETDGTLAGTKWISGGDRWTSASVLGEDLVILGDRVAKVIEPDGRTYDLDLDIPDTSFAREQIQVFEGRGYGFGIDSFHNMELRRIELPAGIVLSDRTEAVKEGEVAATAIRLRSEPTDPVVLNVAVSDSTQASVVENVTFDSSNWFEPQSLQLTGLPDFRLDGDVEVSLTVQVAPQSDSGYSNVSYPNVSINVIDGGDDSFITGSRLRIFGSSDDDKILVETIEHGVRVTVNGQSRVHNGTIEQIRVVADSGDDTVEVRSQLPLRAFLGGGDDYLRTTAESSVFGQGGDDTIKTAGGSDTIVGGNGRDLIESGAGRDSIKAGRRNDTVLSGAGDDTVYGGSGADIIAAGRGADSLTGNNGRDLLLAGAGRDTVRGGKSQDLIIAGVHETSNIAKTLSLIGMRWNSAGTYEDRVAVLTGTGNGIGLLVRDTNVLNDHIVDTLLGGEDRDWFFAVNQDALPDRLQSEILS